MDIEGYEINALKGAKETILRFHPKLAICAYHKVDDFFTIPELVLSYRNDYKVYMRHYTEGLLETVYYFIPK
ncbi:FkbM family methyltransferase [Pectobacterium odoriferum]